MPLVGAFLGGFARMPPLGLERMTAGLSTTWPGF
jgi:hypothetical protein